MSQIDWTGNGITRVAGFLGPFIPLSVPAAKTLSSPLGGAPSANLNFRMQQQILNQWCWAATASSVSDYYYSIGGRPVVASSQCQTASACLQTACCVASVQPSCNKPYYLDDALKVDGSFAAPYLGPLPFGPGAGTVQDEIDAGRPIGCHINWGNRTGHFVVIVGYDNANADVVIADPWTGSISPVPYNSFVTAYQSSGRWDYTYLTH